MNTSSTWLLLRRGIRRGMLTLVREREYGTTLGVLIGVAFLAQLLVLTALATQSMRGLLQSQLDLRLQVRDTAPDQQVQEFLVVLREQPFTEAVRFVTREEAYEQEKIRNPELTSFFSDFQIDNPFPDTIAVTLTSLSDYDAFSAFTRQAVWKDIVDPAFLTQTTNQEQEVRQMLRLTDAGRNLTVGFLVVTGAVLLFVLVELTRRRALARRDEILVERLFGARETSVLIPFATEASVLLLVAMTVSALLIAGLIVMIQVFVPAFALGGSLMSLRTEIASLLRAGAPIVLALECAAVPLLAMAGAYLGMSGRRGEMALG